MLQHIRFGLAAIFSVLLADCPPEPIVDTSRQYQENAGKFVQEPAASSIFPTDGVKFYPLEIGSGTPVVSGGTRTWLVELRGWISVSPNCNARDPDWHYELEVDPDWADSVGMPLALLLRAGNIIVMTSNGNETEGDTYFQRVVSLPHVHVELNGYVPSQHDGRAAPSSWSWYGRVCQFADEPWTTVVWPFDPLKPLPWQNPLSDGDYVRMYGALITDQSHAWTTVDHPWEMNEALKMWGEYRPDEDSANQARWTEMHPPDIIAILPQKPHTTTLRGVLVSAGHCLIGPCETTTLDANIDAPQPKPQGAPRVIFREQVIPLTNFATVRDGHRDAAGNFDGATLTVTGTGIHVHVVVQGQSLNKAPGRFAALYRVSWAPPAPGGPAPAGGRSRTSPTPERPERRGTNPTP
jgi:hypothetical protein